VPPLAVCVDEKVPQLPGEHDQSTPPPLGVSLVTVAMSVALWPSTIVLFGTPCVSCTEIGATMVTPTVIDALEFATDCATIDTLMLVEPAGKLGGAVNTVAVPLAVCEGLNVPHGVVEQLTVQVTPELEGSFSTTAMMGAVAPVNMVLGGNCVRLTATCGDTTKVAKALKLWSAVAKAVIVTVAPTMFGFWNVEGIVKLTGPPEVE